jgi:dihydroneopterin aldolase|tara:strand:- start:225 stop:647 length:423 start_codon:yes stop_codon:yes gene_type:complete
MVVMTISAMDPIENRLLEKKLSVSKLFFRDLEIDVHIGINDSEQGRSQKVLINITLYMADTEGPKNDSITEVFNYDRVRDAVHALIQKRHINLQETLVEEIADMCFRFEEVAGVRISSEKTDVYEDCSSVGSEIVRLRDI